MIPLIVLNRTDNHIRDIDAEDLPPVADAYKKGAPSLVTTEQKNATAVRCKWPDAALYSGVRPLLFRQVEAA